MEDGVEQEMRKMDELLEIITELLMNAIADIPRTHTIATTILWNKNIGLQKLK